MVARDKVDCIKRIVEQIQRSDTVVQRSNINACSLMMPIAHKDAGLCALPL
jgi:hypothetical protein